MRFVYNNQCAIFTPAMKKPTTIVDKSWVQRVCERPNISDRTFDLLKQKCQPVVASVLMEEILANHFQPNLNQATVSRMRRAVLDFHPHWMKHPAELVFEELVKNEPILDAGLSQEQAMIAREAMSDPAKLGNWMASRHEEKEKRSTARKQQQAWFQKNAPDAFLHPPDLVTFAKNGSSFLAMVLKEPDLKKLVLEAYLGQTWKRWHSAETAEIDIAFARLDCELVLKLPCTHSYLLAEFLYDVGPITKIGPPESKKSNPHVLSGKQNNNEEDQEYVASALYCDRLLTCDDGMRQIAQAFREAGYWKGKCILIPGYEADQLERHFA